jgi:hypothetical protein
VQRQEGEEKEKARFSFFFLKRLIKMVAALRVGEFNLNAKHNTVFI